MRIIKFKCWDKEQGRFYTQEEMHEIGGLYYNGVMEEANEPNSPYVLCQFTGLLDSKGKEIYTGDVVKTKWQEAAEMIWVDSEAAFGLRTIDDVVKDEIMYGFKDTEMKIIGNIYENPDLITPPKEIDTN